MQQIDTSCPWSVLLSTTEMISTCSNTSGKPQVTGFTVKLIWTYLRAILLAILDHVVANWRRGFKQYTLPMLIFALRDFGCNKAY